MANESTFSFYSLIFFALTFVVMAYSLKGSYLWNVFVLSYLIFKEQNSVLYLLTGLIIIVPLLVGLIFSSPSKEKMDIKYWTILFIIILIIATVTDLLDKTIAQNYYTYKSLEELKIYLIQNIKEKSYLNLGPIIDTLAFIFGTFLKNRHK